MPKGYIEIACQYKRHSSSRLAILVNDGDNDVWLPVSQIEEPVDLDAFHPGEHITVLIPEWLATEKKLI